ncbi:ubiquitin-conjugating enzyme/RWD-like protein [Apodospora peruviana]|uniref:Ubiquitin-conjugating enzyme/RWD-like protein n=1 Tax=Apodospora peruviana TaxID=516989 RepID=A0AAE0IAV1_9PEZI|nr:ubiquitin-conjugating enzyme/RWD-like protein [Apodospora peruviana]
MSGGGSLFSQKRTIWRTSSRFLLAEIKAMAGNEHEDIDVFVSERDMGYWKVVLQAPDGSPNEGGVFVLDVDVGVDFPRVPLTIRFVTPILHPNISKQGRICHPIFDREWNRTLRIYQILNAHLRPPDDSRVPRYD